MSETAWLIGEIVVGIAFLGVLAALVTAVMVPVLSRSVPAQRSTAEVILEERYARGDLTREQFLQLRQDIGIGPGAVAGGCVLPAVDRDASGATAARAAI